MDGETTEFSETIERATLLSWERARSLDARGLQWLVLLRAVALDQDRVLATFIVDRDRFEGMAAQVGDAEAGYCLLMGFGSRAQELIERADDVRLVSAMELVADGEEPGVRDRDVVWDVAEAAGLLRDIAEGIPVLRGVSLRRRGDIEGDDIKLRVSLPDGLYIAAAEPFRPGEAGGYKCRVYQVLSEMLAEHFFANWANDPPSRILAASGASSRDDEDIPF